MLEYNALAAFLKGLGIHVSLIQFIMWLLVILWYVYTMLTYAEVIKFYATPLNLNIEIRVHVCFELNGE